MHDREMHLMRRVVAVWLSHAHMWLLSWYVWLFAKVSVSIPRYWRANRRWYQFIFGKYKVFPVSHESLMHLITEYSHSRFFRPTMDDYEILEAFAAWMSEQSGVWLRYHSTKGFMIICRDDETFIQWKLTHL